MVLFSVRQYGCDGHTQIVCMVDCMCVAGRQNFHPAELLSLCSQHSPKTVEIQLMCSQNQIHLTTDGLMWERQPCVVVVVVVIFVCGSGKGFRYFDATHCQVGGFLNYVFRYKMDCSPSAVG